MPPCCTMGTSRYDVDCCPWAVPTAVVPLLATTVGLARTVSTVHKDSLHASVLHDGNISL